MQKQKDLLSEKTKTELPCHQGPVSDDFVSVCIGERLEICICVLVCVSVCVFGDSVLMCDPPLAVMEDTSRVLYVNLWQ